ncbi:MAG TPA: NADPH:quinone oxidoreductase family protein [Kofleriaceae bacterium]|nr:NADPH:quinone oxidoreductase family protein [Kofleriaceae bacterium]
MASSSRRVVVSELGEDPLATLDQHVRLEPALPPDPSQRAPHEVIVDVRSAAVGWVDLLMLSGQYQHEARPPYTPGLEYAGEVSWAGPASGFRPGDRVVVDPILAGPRSSGPYRAWGGFASQAVAPGEAVHGIPGALSFDQAAGLLGSYETAYHCLVARGRLQAGETILVHGASGSTGLAAVHIARLLGATVIATGRSPEKLAVVREQGAHHVIAGASFRDEVKQLTSGRGVDVVYDPVGGDISIESLRCVRFGARFLIVGWAATPFVADGKGRRGAPRANQLPTNLVLMKGLDVLGCPTVIATAMDPTLRAPRLAQVLAWAEAGQIVPFVSHVFPLDRFQDAMRAKWSGEVIGGCVLHP